jgi:hypothetical protein
MIWLMPLFALTNAFVLEVRFQNIITNLDPQILGINSTDTAFKNFDPLNGLYNV